jgi:DNA repair exonuclease SbcCD ATPase subunit
MNKQRRKDIAIQGQELAKVRDAVEALINNDLQVTERKTAYDEIGSFDTIADEVDTLRDEEQEYLDGMPESLQNGERAGEAQEAIDTLENAAETIRSANEELENLDLDLEDQEFEDAVNEVLDHIDEAADGLSDATGGFTLPTPKAPKAAKVAKTMRTPQQILEQAHVQANAPKTKPGIIGALVALLADGTPRTRAELYAALAEQFPDRATAEGGMRVTIGVQLVALVKKGHKIQNADKKYWI